jgi:hypothetical protein
MSYPYLVRRAGLYLRQFRVCVQLHVQVWPLPPATATACAGRDQLDVN